LYQLAKIGKQMRSCEADVRDLATLQCAISEHRPEVVFHLAAQSVVRRSYREPVDTYATNVLGTVNLLEAVRHADSPCAVVIVTSDKCYEPHAGAEPPPHAEGDHLGGHDPYSNSKACAELVTAAYRRSYGLNVATVRAGNAIGGGDWTEGQLIPELVRGAVAQRPAQLRNPEAVRPWQFVLEPLAGYVQVAECLAQGDRSAATSWNFGPDASEIRSVSWIADFVVRRWGEGASYESDPIHSHPHETQCLRLDAGKAREQLGWAPRLSLDTALEWTVDWYKGLHAGADAAKLTLRDIARYEELSCVAPLQHLPAAV
jgi:CDP-glucose 4,6-dehydratase